MLRCRPRDLHQVANTQPVADSSLRSSKRSPRFVRNDVCYPLYPKFQIRISQCPCPLRFACPPEPSLGEGGAISPRKTGLARLSFEPRGSSASGGGYFSRFLSRLLGSLNQRDPKEREIPPRSGIPERRDSGHRESSSQSQTKKPEENSFFGLFRWPWGVSLRSHADCFCSSYL